MVDIVALNACNPLDVEDLLDDAFGTDRHQRTAYRLRDGTSAVDHLSFGLLDDGALIGSIQCWPVQLMDGNNTAPLLLVGPVAVASNRQMKGLGHMLMNQMLANILLSDPPMVMIGDPEYYERFGFHATHTQGWELPGPWERHRLLLRNNGNRPLPVGGKIAPRP